MLYRVKTVAGYYTLTQTFMPYSSAKRMMIIIGGKAAHSKDFKLSTLMALINTGDKDRKDSKGRN
ncbi:hypothetical protein GCM10007941_40380 [Amphritea balenae]|nr:hypothetical protein GCM10007941_40380 [Amphritea balenae]